MACKKKKLAKGGKVKNGKYITNDPNDPRIQAHADSLALYNSNETLRNNLIKEGYNSTKNDSIQVKYNNRYLDQAINDYANYADGKYTYNTPYSMIEKANPTKDGNLYRVGDLVPHIINEKLGTQLFSKDILPIGRQQWSSDWLGIPGLGDKRITFDYSNVKPRQEVIYQPDPLTSNSIVNKSTVIRSNKNINPIQSKRGNIQNNINTNIQPRSISPIPNNTTMAYRRTYDKSKGGMGYMQMDRNKDGSINEQQFITPKEMFELNVTNPNYGGSNFNSQQLANGGKINNNMIRKNFKSRTIPKLANGGQMYSQQDTSNIDNSFDWGNVGIGAASGAAAGSVAGPWGAVIGGVVGGATSALNSANQQGAAQDQLAAIEHQNAISKAEYDKNRIEQAKLGIGNMYSMYANGGKITRTVPSPFPKDTYTGSYQEYLDKKREQELIARDVAKFNYQKKHPQPGTINYSKVDPIMLGVGLSGAASKLIGNELFRRSTLYNGFQLGKNAPSGTLGGAISAVAPSFLDDIVTSSVGLINDDNKKAKGGKINTTASTKKIGNGIQVNGNSRKDAIPANIGGTDVRLDNREIVDGDVVISDDLGEAAMYRKMIASGMNPDEVSAIMKQRAVQLNPNPGMNAAYGGYIPPYSATFNPDEFTRSNNMLTKLNTRKTNLIPNKINTILPQSPMTTYPDFGMPNLQSNNDYIASTITNPNQAQFVPNNTSPTAFDPTKIASPSGNYSGATSRSNVFGRIGNYMSDPNNRVNIGEGLGTVASIAGNIHAMNKLNKTRMSPAVTNRYIAENIDVNRPIYENQISNIKGSNRNLGKQILGNTANSNVAMSRLGALKAQELGQIGGVRSQQAADRGNISNRNTQGINQTNMYNNQLINNQNQMMYQDQLGRINTQNALIGASVQQVDNLINNIRKGQYQAEQLDAIAKGYGLQGTGWTSDSLYNALMKKFGTSVQTLKGE